ncbi:hypothetical protein NN561_017797 [Cricetulus griseus]
MAKALTWGRQGKKVTGEFQTSGVPLHSDPGAWDVGNSADRCGSPSAGRQTAVEAPHHYSTRARVVGSGSAGACSLIPHPHPKDTPRMLALTTIKQPGGLAKVPLSQAATCGVPVPR